ncbi:Glycoside hydrolase, family 28 [Dillenia turbinata]|uniref:Glycoside hydrolase, family 28 n=1 Tax=Dillenia turbinata TaxID=194707 RepID=A0AAN8VMR3_9MAGN
MLAVTMKILALCFVFLVTSCKCESWDFSVAPAPQIETPSEETAPSPAPEAPSPAPEAPSPVPEGWFDVTKYGAIGDGVKDCSSAFLAAWKAACNHGGESTFFIPEGTFLVGHIIFEGPCYNEGSPLVLLNGTLHAPSSPEAFHDDEWIKFQDLRELHVVGGTGTSLLDGQGQEARKHSTKKRPVSLKLLDVVSGSIRNINLLNSKFFNMNLQKCQNITVLGVNITAPSDSPNTDGIHLSQSTNMNITSSIIGVGDDCISIGPGNTDIFISNITCGPGHGISVGSLGKYSNEEDVVGIRVRNCTINGTTNGVRIKSWRGSPVSNALNMTFEDILMINVSNPIIIDQEYCPHKDCSSLKPSKVKLNNVGYRNIWGTSNTKAAVTLVCSSSTPCENVHLTDINFNYTIQEHKFKDSKYKSDDQNPHIPCLSVKGALNGLQISNFQV